MLLSDEDYAYVIGLLDGRIQRSSLLEELADWAKQELGIEVFAYFCDYANAGFLRLRIVLWNEWESRKMEYHTERKCRLNPKIQKKFQVQFAALSVKYGMHPEYQDSRSIWVCYETIEDKIQSRILWGQREKILGLALRRRDIWKIDIIFSSVHFFYETDEQIQMHEKDGVSSALQQSCMDIVKEYDKFGVFSQGVSCVFTSKQTLDEKYAGSMFYYTR